ncbi:hypothetical protein N0V90_002090 [Kalmusia sp. IMI 367209]|nr:hypothetical protein N0V90_002090 [Kalmusia sp. IMI 367209]
MKISPSLLLATTWCSVTISAAPLEESIVAQQLIGSHFGVPGIPASYDYVILGGGTAGLALARRLAADSRYTVAVVNAGDFAEFANGNYSQIPAYASVFGGSNPVLKNPLLDWGHASIGALKKWAQLTGDNAYLFENLLPFYKKVSTFTPPNTKTRLANATTLYNPALYSNGGPVQASYPNWANPISSWLQKALEALGLKNLSGGLADGNIWGYGYPVSSIDPKSESRSSAETSYLREALKQTTNLNLYKDTLAKKILFDGNKKATGALVESGGVEFPLTANKEVIVSAGFARSPQLLMVSGIGPAATLQGLGISVLSDLPGVGQNMWDHTLVSPTYAVNVLTHNAFSDPAIIVEHTNLYRNSLTGLLTNNGGDILAFSKLPNNSISKSTLFLH